MARRRSRESRVESLYRTHVPDGLRLAELLSNGDAAECVKRAFVKAIATFRDRRSPMTFDASFRRIVIKECRRPIIRRWLRSARAARPDAPPDLWRAFRALSHRRKSALVLRYFELMTDEQVGEVLGCSTGAARSLVNRALAGLQGSAAPDASPARVAGELQRIFRTRAGRAADVVEPDALAVRRAVLGRRANAAGAVLALTAVVAAGILAVRIAM